VGERLVNTLKPELAKKQDKLNADFDAANREYHDKFLRTLSMLQELESLEQFAGERVMTRRKPLSSAEAIKEYEKDLTETFPSTIDEDEDRLNRVMDEIEARCEMPYQSSKAKVLHTTYYLEADRCDVEAIKQIADEVKSDLAAAIKKMRHTWGQIEKLRSDPG
jgi:hypothetical protein